jgi:hypothetical protein
MKQEQASILGGQALARILILDAYVGVVELQTMSAYVRMPIYVVLAHRLIIETSDDNTCI